MSRFTSIATSLLIALGTTASAAHAADVRPGPLPAHVVALASHHDSTSHHDDGGQLDKGEVKREADDEGKDRDCHRHHHPATPD